MAKVSKKAEVMGAEVAPTPRPRPRARSSKMRVAPRPSFVFLCSPLEVDMVDGEAVPRLIRFSIVPGVNGVPGVQKAEEELGVQWQGAVAMHCERTGRILVDPARYGLKVTLNDQGVEPNPVEDRNDPRNWYTRTYDGHKGAVNVSIWEIPRVLGNTVMWSKDKDGELAFRREIKKKILGGLDPSVKEHAVENARVELAEHEGEAKRRPALKRNVEAAKRALGDNE